LSRSSRLTGAVTASALALDALSMGTQGAPKVEELEQMHAKG
jgi:hypothetical protein